ncbi:MAG: hypothetical protein Q6356_008055 [Candidatus Wukongarchaeota archaeon]|nr:hypothetical protein [Candidatus Wukongarchaeota archaeon]
MGEKNFCEMVVGICVFFNIFWVMIILVQRKFTCRGYEGEEAAVC